MTHKLYRENIAVYTVYAASTTVHTANYRTAKLMTVYECIMCVCDLGGLLLWQCCMQFVLQRLPNV